MQGGNWIATDSFLLNGDSERYDAEVRLHRHSGFNLIRVWGGGLPESDHFYQACDEAGIAVFQEFWMSGDNNGRWGGSYDYPFEKDAYLEMVEDTVLRLRGHPSLMFWGGGNELWPASKSPPPVIRSGLEKTVAALDDRFLILSSMDGGYDGLNMSMHSDSFALAVKDGPYGFLSIDRYYSEPNPGMTNGSSVTVAFQPEVGGSSMVRLSGLKRMGLADAGSYPGRFDADTPDLWSFHKFQGYTYSGPDGEERDAIWDYGPPASLSGYVARANMACAQQYQALFEGFSAKAFGPAASGGKTGVILWKSQSPWPALRGFIYDWWLESVGMGDGVRLGLGGGGRWKAQLDLSEGGGVDVVNRGPEPLVGGGKVDVSAFTFKGEEVQRVGFEVEGGVGQASVRR